MLSGSACPSQPWSYPSLTQPHTQSIAGSATEVSATDRKTTRPETNVCGWSRGKQETTFPTFFDNNTWRHKIPHSRKLVENLFPIGFWYSGQNIAGRGSHLVSRKGHNRISLSSNKREVPVLAKSWHQSHGYPLYYRESYPAESHQAPPVSDWLHHHYNLQYKYDMQGKTWWRVPNRHILLPLKQYVASRPNGFGWEQINENFKSVQCVCTARNFW